MAILAFIRQYKSLVLLLLLSVVSIRYISVVSYVIVPGGFFLLWRSSRYLEMMLFYFSILIFSDSFFLPAASTLKQILSVMWLGFWFIDGREKWEGKPVYYPLIPFFIIAFFAMGFSPIPFVSFQKWLAYGIIWIVLPTYFEKILIDEGRFAFLRDWICLGSIFLLASVGFYYLDTDVAIHNTGRFRGVFGNPNGLGMFVVFLFFLYSLLRSMDSTWRRLDHWIFIFLVVACLIPSGSRSSALALLLFLVVLKTFKVSPILSVIVGVAVAIFGQMGIDKALIYLQEAGYTEALRLETLESGSGRLVAWQFAMQLLDTSGIEYFFGRGFGFTEHYFFDEENKVILSTLGHQGHAHNSFLTFWIDAGLIGLIALLVGLVVLTYRASMNTANAANAVAMLIGALFLCMFESWLTASGNPYTIQFILCYFLMINDAPEVQQVEGEETEGDLQYVASVPK